MIIGFKGKIQNYQRRMRLFFREYNIMIITLFGMIVMIIGEVSEILHQFGTLMRLILQQLWICKIARIIHSHTV